MEISSVVDIAIVQRDRNVSCSFVEDVEEILMTVSSTTGRKQKCDFVLFPEDFSKLKLYEDGNEVKVKFLGELASKFDTHIVFSAIVEKVELGRYISTVVFSPKGHLIGKHKMKNRHPYLEDESDHGIIETMLGKIGILICIEVEHDLTRTACLGHHPSLIFNPAYIVRKRHSPSHTLARTTMSEKLEKICVDEQLWILRCDHPSPNSQVTSQIISPYHTIYPHQVCSTILPYRITSQNFQSRLSLSPPYDYRSRERDNVGNRYREITLFRQSSNTICDYKIIDLEKCLLLVFVKKKSRLELLIINYKIHKTVFSNTLCALCSEEQEKVTFLFSTFKEKGKCHFGLTTKNQNKCWVLKWHKDHFSLCTYLFGKKKKKKKKKKKESELERRSHFLFCDNENRRVVFVSNGKKKEEFFFVLVSFGKGIAVKKVEFLFRVIVKDLIHSFFVVLYFSKDESEMESDAVGIFCVSQQEEGVIETETIEEVDKWNLLDQQKQEEKEKEERNKIVNFRVMRNSQKNKKENKERLERDEDVNEKEVDLKKILREFWSKHDIRILCCDLRGDVYEIFSGGTKKIQILGSSEEDVEKKKKGKIVKESFLDVLSFSKGEERKDEKIIGITTTGEMNLYSVEGEEASGNPFRFLVGSSLRHYGCSVFVKKMIFDDKCRIFLHISRSEERGKGKVEEEEEIKMFHFVQNNVKTSTLHQMMTE